MSGKKKKSKSTKAAAAAAATASQKSTSDDGPARIGGAANENGSVAATAAANSSGGKESFIRDLPPPSQTVHPRGAAAFATPGGAFTTGATTIPSSSGGGGEVETNNCPPHFSHLEQPIPMTHSYSLPSLPTTSLRPRMTSILVEGGGGAYNNDPSNPSLIDRDLLQQPPTAPVPLLSRTLSTPESSSNLRSAFGRAGSAFGRFSTATSRPNTTTYTQSDPGFSAFHPVTWNCQRSLSSAGSGSLVGSEIIEEHDVGSGLKTSARTSSAPSNNMTRGFLLKAREKLQTTKLQTTKRRSGRENPARPSLSDTEDASSPPATVITNNDDGVEISIVAEDKSEVPPKIERVKPPSKIGALRKPKRSATKSKPVANEGQHEDPPLELNFSESDDDGSIDEVKHEPGVEIALKPKSNRPPSRADNIISQVPFDEKAQNNSHVATTPKTSAVGAVAAKFKFKSPQRSSKAVNSPSSFTSSSPHQSPNAGTTSSSSDGSPDSRGGLSTISSNSNSIASATNTTRSKINSAASSPGGGDSCAKESMGSSTTNSEIRDIVKQSQKKNIRPLRPAGNKEGNVEDYETVSVDMDGNATVHSSSADSCSSPCLREGAINPHIEGLALTPGGAPSVSPNRFSVAAHEAPFDEQSSGSPEVVGNTDSPVVKKEGGGISRFISFNSKKEVRSQSPHSTDAHTTSSASASNASVSNATSSSSSGGGSQQPVMFVAYERVEERDSPFDEHHHEENRVGTPQNLIRPTITSVASNTAGQRPPFSPRKMMSGRVSTPSPTHAQRDTLLSGANTPASPPTIADRHVLVRDLAGAESGSRSAIPKPKSNRMPGQDRMKMILVPPKVHVAPVVSPERHHSQAASVSIENLQQQMSSAIISPEKAT
ncbi:hypothetical protein QTG54_004765 [Skeletonema marinoi]|uniref:Uncharacterized protein n=2 Tax=Skeletonema marinoi TaxID=267567 RepID=A0AAD8YF12_9STRA|nr:hypothetical protein QTG54_004765 [Skeletonema marinoi]